jgi:hypothetical protein
VAGATLLGLCFLGGLVYMLTLRQRRRRKLSYEIDTSAGFDSSSVAQVSYPTQIASSSEPPASVVPFVSVIPPRLSEKRCQVGGVLTSNKSVSANSQLHRVESLIPQNTVPYQA